MGWRHSGSCVSIVSQKKRTKADAAVSYLFNPFTIATCIGRPTSVFTTCAVLYAVAKACTGRPLTAMLALGLASYLSLYPTLLLPPLILLCYDHLNRDGKAERNLAAFALYHTTAFFTSIACFLSESYLLMGGSWEFISSTYGIHLLLPDLTPNVGLWWYFFIEMFDSFREFFLGVFWLHLGGYVGGLCLRVRRQPLFVITMTLGLFAIFKPYPSISDTSLFFALLPCYRHVFPCKSWPRYRPGGTKELTRDSDAIYVLRHGRSPLRDAFRPGVLLSVDLRRIGECELLLRHHPCLEPRIVADPHGFIVRSAAR